MANIQFIGYILRSQKVIRELGVTLLLLLVIILLPFNMSVSDSKVVRYSKGIDYKYQQTQMSLQLGKFSICVDYFVTSI